MFCESLLELVEETMEGEGETMSIDDYVFLGILLWIGAEKWCTDNAILPDYNEGALQT